MAAKYELDDYVFLNAADFERAKKERETIAYISARTDMTDMKALYKIYRIAAKQKSFQTVFGLEYMKDLRDRLVGSGAVTEDLLEPIPVGNVVVSRTVEVPVSEEEKEWKKGQEQIEKMRLKNVIKNVLIGVLVLVIGGMFYITYNYKYSIFTFFTNYKEKMRDEIIDEYKDWEMQLEERERKVEEREGEKADGTDQNLGGR